MNKAFWYLHIAVLLAGLTGVFGKLITLNEAFLTWYRMIISGLLLILILKTIRRKEKISISAANAKMALNGLLLGLHWIFFYGSIKYSNISVGVLCFCLTGFFTALLEPLINRRRISVKELGLSTLNILGISTIFHFDTSFRTGIFLGIISAMLNAIFTIINEKMTRNNDVIKTTTLQISGGAVGLSILLPLYLQVTDTPFRLPGLQDLLYLFILSSLCTVGIYLLINSALKYLSAFTVNLSFNLEPIYSILIAVAFFGESRQLTVSFFAGLSLILLSLTLQTIRILRNKGVSRSSADAKVDS